MTVRAAGRSPRRVLLVLPGAFGVIGGIQMYDRLLIKAFSKLMAAVGGKCEVLILNDPDSCFQPRYATVATTSRSFNGNRLRFAAAAVTAARRSRPDLIVLGHVHFAPLALLLRSIDPQAAQWFIVYGIDVWKRLSAHVRYALRHSEKIVSISEFTRRELAARNGLPVDHCDLLPCALDPFWTEDHAPILESATFPPAPILLSCGRLDPRDREKGIDHVIRAMQRVISEYPDARLVIVGDGSDRPYLEKLAHDVGVNAHVEFRGRASSLDLAREYARCSLFVMPSRKEGFGIVFLEAAFFGKASVAGNHGGSPEFVDDSIGWLVEHGDVEQLSAILIDALKKTGTLSGKGAAARARVTAEYLFETFVERLGALMQVDTEGAAVAAG